MDLIRFGLNLVQWEALVKTKLHRVPYTVTAQAANVLLQRIQLHGVWCGIMP